MRRSFATIGAICLFSTPVQAATFSGSAFGEWSNPDGSIGFSIANNDLGGLAEVTWGEPSPGSFTNFWRFDGIGSDGGTGWETETDELFRLGDFSYRNGSVSGHNFSGADLSISLNFDRSVLETIAFDFEFDVDNVPNTNNDPVLDGDFATIQGGLTNQAFTFDGIDYTLELFGFSQDRGQTLVDSFRSPEGTTAVAALYGRITEAAPDDDVPPRPDPDVIPLPATAPLILGGMFLLGFVARRRK